MPLDLLRLPRRNIIFGDDPSPLFKSREVAKADVGVSSPPASRYCVFTKGAGLATSGVLLPDGTIQLLFGTEHGVAESDKEY